MVAGLGFSGVGWDDELFVLLRGDKISVGVDAVGVGLVFFE